MNVDLRMFEGCSKLEEIHLPSSLNKFKKEYIINIPKLKSIYVVSSGKEIEINLIGKKFIENNSDKLLLLDSDKEIYSFYHKGEYIEFPASLLTNNPRIRMIKNGLVSEKDYINLYYWHNKKIIPSPSFIKAMPFDEIDKFFVNKNCVEWAKLVKESNVKDYPEGITSFFKLSYVLGIFSESTTTRDKAITFIRKNIINIQ